MRQTVVWSPYAARAWVLRRSMNVRRRPMVQSGAKMLALDSECSPVGFL